ncbi:hypothetical protein DSM3645_12036 [Blastopirellula marina DSM 3645]|uniref:Uncharacterized protein n=1 Tax=Blastopirellula marina DSM 3645 TaxID=314230 RepID=A3ZRH7_9BACT|nr:hypothetical protein DSM3645_12036 [Blastopirellula marina DSM 3645]
MNYTGDGDNPNKTLGTLGRRFPDLKPDLCFTFSHLSLFLAGERDKTSFQPDS